MSFEDLKVRTLVDLDVDPLFTLPNSFVGCDSLGLITGFIDNVNFTITDDSVVFNGLGGVDGVITAFTTTTPINLGSNKFWFETTVTAVDGANTVIGTCINLFDKTDLDGAVIQLNIGGVAAGFSCSSLFDEFPPPLAGFVNTSLSLPYTIQTRLNGATGEISYEDTAGNFGSLGIYPTLNAEPLSLNPIGVSNPEKAGYTGFESGAYGLNAGYVLPVIAPPAGFTTYCHIEPPPIGFCREIALGIMFQNDATSVISGNEAVTTSLSTSPSTIGIAFLADNTVEARINTDKFAFEMIAQQPSFLGENVFGVAFGSTDLFGSNPVGGFGLGVAAGGSGIGDFQISFIDGFAAAPVVILSNLTIAFPYIVKVVINGDNLTFKDNQIPANTGVLGTSVGLSSFFGGFVLANGVNNSASGNTQTLKIEGNKQNFVVDFENDALAWCDLEQNGGGGDVLYDYLELLADGEAGFFERVAGWSTVNGVSNTWIGSSSYSVFSQLPLDNFVFESQTTVSDLDATSGGRFHAYTLGDIGNDIHQFGINTNQVIQGSSETQITFLSVNTLNNQYSKQVGLFNISTEVEFVTAVIPISKTEVRVCYQTSKQTVFFDAVNVQDYGDNRFVWTSLSGSNPPASGLDYRVKYNGKNDDLIIENYPDGTLSYQGNPLPDRTNFETKNANWLLDYDLTISENPPTDYIEITNGGLTATARLAQNAGFWLNCARFVTDDFSSTFAVTIRVNQLPFVGGLPNRYRLELNGVNHNSKMGIEVQGVDLVLTRTIGGSIQPVKIIKANYVAAQNDQLCLAYDSSTNAINGILNQGEVLFQTGNWGMGGVSASYMPRAGHQLAVGNGTMSIQNQYENANLTPTVLKSYLTSINAVDILGAPIIV